MCYYAHLSWNDIKELICLYSKYYLLYYVFSFKVTKEEEEGKKEKKKKEGSKTINIFLPLIFVR